MENGDNLNPGFVYDISCPLELRRGYAASHQSVNIIPWPKNENKFILFHKLKEFHPEPIDGSFSDNLETMMTVIDIKLGEGKGAVTSKNVVFDTTRVEPTMYFNRHANGEDWWMLSPHRFVNKYSVFLIDSSGVHLQSIQETGLAGTIRTMGGDQGLFNPNGDQFYRWNSKQGMQIFDFDRQTGALSNFRHIPLASEDQAIGQNAQGGMGISPSGQYAYASNVYTIFQYDLWADDVAASQLPVAEVGNPDNLPQGLQPSAMSFQLGPDCKLYCFTITGDAHHVIHNPDERGLACDWEQGGLQLPFPVFRDQIYYPNFRLGPQGDEGSPCAEPIVSSTGDLFETTVAFNVSPNPAAAYFDLSLGPVSGARHLTWELFSSDGRLVRSQQLNGFGEDIRLQRAGLPSGLYLWRLRNKARFLKSGKLVLK